jgi:hypothetical protein
MRQVTALGPPVATGGCIVGWAAVRQRNDWEVWKRSDATRLETFAYLLADASKAQIIELSMREVPKAEGGAKIGRTFNEGGPAHSLTIGLPVAIGPFKHIAAEVV